MSTIEDHTKIDKLAVAAAGDCAVLMIVDPLSWDDSTFHISQLEKKLSCYLGYVKTGQLLEDLPAARQLPVRIDVLCQYPLSEVGKRVAEASKRAMRSNGIDIKFVVL